MFKNSTLRPFPPLPTSDTPAAVADAMQKRFDDHQEALFFLDDLQDIVLLRVDNPQTNTERRRASVLLSRARRWFKRGNIAGVCRLLNVYA